MEVIFWFKVNVEIVKQMSLLHNGDSKNKFLLITESKNAQNDVDLLDYSIQTENLFRTLNVILFKSIS